MSQRHSKIVYVPIKFEAASVSFTTSGWNSLSPREKDVARLIAEGMSDKEVADVLRIGVRTVEYHVGNIFNKLDTRSRVKVGIIASNHH